MRVHLSRWVSLDVESNLRRCAVESRTAAAAGAELVVFPESFLHGYHQQVAPQRVRAVFAEISGSHRAATFVFGSFTENRRNRMTVWREGRELARYDKVHLFALHEEQKLWEAGDRYAAVRLDGWTLGLLNCYDLRFPEQARVLRLHAGCSALMVVAWWPARRELPWRTLLQARAMENGVWVLGCCVSSAHWQGREFSGAGNFVFDPDGEEVSVNPDGSYSVSPDAPSAPAVDSTADYRPVKELELFDGSGSSVISAGD